MPGGKNAKHGFTLIEVALVLAIAGLLFAGVIGGTAANITRQRYNDSVQSFAEFLRRQYSEVVNVENVRTDELDNDVPCTVYSSLTLGNPYEIADVQTGRTDCLIYGKLITFGEYTASEDADDIIHSYDVIGEVINGAGVNALDVYGLSVLESLYVLDADVVTVRDENAVCNYAYAGNTSSYRMQWDAVAETTSPDHEVFYGSILIVRSPVSGAVHTYYMEDTVDVQELLATNPTPFECHSASYAAAVSNANNRINSISSSNKRYGVLQTYLDDSDDSVNHFYTEEIQICVGSDDIFALNGQRRMIRIAEDGANASAVELIAADDTDDFITGKEGTNKCQ